MPEPIRVILIGLGPLGRMLTPYLAEKSSLKLIGGVDIDPELVGRDLGELAGLDPQNTPVVSSLDDAGEGDVAVVTTVSSLALLRPTLEQALERDLHVVSTCEELSYPWTAQPDLAQAIDAAAREAGRTVLGTGVNPGFLMDFLPVAASAVCRRVDRVLVERIQDASFRRLPFRQKIGAGLSPAEFQSRVQTGKIRHVGLTESMHLIAARLGWVLDRTEDVVEPVIADADVVGDGWKVEAGAATGVNQIGRGFIGSDEVVTLVFRAAVGQPDPRDTVTLTGTPDYVVNVPGGTNGDVATCAIVANAVPIAVMAAPGLRTMADVPAPSCIP